MTEDAVKARIEGLAGHVTNITLTSDLEKTMVDRVDSFYKLVEVSSIIAGSTCSILPEIFLCYNHNER